MSSYEENKRASTARAGYGIARDSNPAPAIVRGVIWAAIALSAFFQVLISASYINITAVFIAATTGTLSTLYIFRSSTFRQAPISSLMVFGVNFTLGIGPLLFQTLDWQPYTFNLDVPLKTVAVTSAITALAIGSHLAYRSSGTLQAFRAGFSNQVLSLFGVFKAPSDIQLWLMGFVGLTAMWFAGAASAKVAYGDVAGKLGIALIPFAAAPFLIPISNSLFRPARSSAVYGWLGLTAYFMLVVAVAMARNSRGAFASTLLVLGLAVGLAALIGQLKISKRLLVILAGVAALSLPAVGFLADLSTAMLINRGIRADISAQELIRRTVDTLGNKRELEVYRTKAAIVSSGFNEIYIRNDFLQRLTLIKFLDLNLKHAEDISDNQREYVRYVFGQRMIAILPTPIIKLFGFQLDKKTVQYSGGDLYVFLASKGKVGGFVTGSAIVDGTVLMGPLFWPVCGLFFIFSFVVRDALCRPLGRYMIFVSPFILMELDYIFMFGLIGENVADSIANLVRVYPQTLILYAVLYYSTWIVSALFTVSTPHLRPLIKPASTQR